MDPLTVIRTIWHHKAFVLPVILVTLTAAAYVFQFGPRYFESSMSYAMVNPRLPTDKEIDTNPELETLNRDNPFLRSSDPSLITEVLIARLSSSQTSDRLETAGLSSDYMVSKGINGNGFVVAITGNGESEKQALATARGLGALLEEELQTIQKVNGADERFLFTALVITSPDKATEQFSSRLRSVIMVILGGAVLMFGSVSLARSLETAKARRQMAAAAPQDPNPAADSDGSSLASPLVSRRSAAASSWPQFPTRPMRVTSATSEHVAHEESPAVEEPARR